LILPLRMPDSLAAGQPCARNFGIRTSALTRIASREATAIITDILCDNDARQKSFGLRSPLAFEERVAAKTGTSSGSATRGLLASTKNTPSPFGRQFRWTTNARHVCRAGGYTALGSHYAGIARRDHPLDPATENDKLIRREICKTTGLLPSRFSNASMPELFLAERSRTKTRTLLCERWEIDFARCVRALVRDPDNYDRRTRAIRFSHHQSAAERSISD
jgi:hypothetical protein